MVIQSRIRSSDHLPESEDDTFLVWTYSIDSTGDPNQGYYDDYVQNSLFAETGHLYVRYLKLLTLSSPRTFSISKLIPVQDSLSDLIVNATSSCKHICLW